MKKQVSVWRSLFNLAMGLIGLVAMIKHHPAGVSLAVVNSTTYLADAKNIGR